VKFSVRHGRADADVAGGVLRDDAQPRRPVLAAVAQRAVVEAVGRRPLLVDLAGARVPGAEADRRAVGRRRVRVVVGLVVVEARGPHGGAGLDAAGARRAREDAADDVDVPRHVEARARIRRPDADVTNCF